VTFSDNAFVLRKAIFIKPYFILVLTAALTRTFSIFTRYSETHYVSEANCFLLQVKPGVMCCFAFFCENGNSYCKCCCYYSCTIIVKSL